MQSQIKISHIILPLLILQVVVKYTTKDYALYLVQCIMLLRIIIML